MNEVFGADYAGIYDLLYQEKDYEGECDRIEALVGAAGTETPRLALLDLGCGTGGHAEVLARRGHVVAGVDRSPHMIAVARQKLRPPAGSAPVEYRVGDLRSVRLARRFDAVIMMFSVLSYQIENDDVLAALGAARAHLGAGGLLLFDHWYGPAVLHQRPSMRSRVVNSVDGPLRRAAAARLDVERQTCEVTISWERRPSEVERCEVHQMRFLFPREIELALSASGFALERRGAWPEVGRPATEDTWNVFVLARAL